MRFVLEPMGFARLRELRQGKPRQCEFRECWVYRDAVSDDPMFFEEVLPGILTDEPKGSFADDSWSPLWLIFIPEGADKTLAEMTHEEREAWRESRNRGSLGEFVAWYLRERAGK